MARTKGTYSLSANIETNAAAPLDARDKVALKTDLTASGSFPYPYVGMETYVVEENKKYRLIGEDPTNIENWQELTGGGGGGGTDSYADLNNKPQINGNTLVGNKTNEQLGIDAVASFVYHSKTALAKQTGGEVAVTLSNLESVNSASVPTADNIILGKTFAYDDTRAIAVATSIDGSSVTFKTVIYDTDADTKAIADLTDVDLNSLANGQILKYDSTAEKWVNADESSGGASDLSDLDDVDVTSPSDGQVLTYDATNQVWKNADGGSTTIDELSDIGDVDLNSLQDGQSIIWDATNSKWVNADVGGGGASALTDLTDVDLSNPSDGQMLVYDATAQKWKNASGGGGGVAHLDDLGDVDLTSLADGQVIKWDATNSRWINANESGGGGGDAELTANVTSNLEVGAIASGTTLPSGTTFTEFVQKLLITEIAPATTFTASGSGVKEVGISVTPTLTLKIDSVGTGTPQSIKFYDGSTLLDTQAYVSGTSTYTYTMSAVTTTTTVKGVLEYKKSDDSSATVEKSATYTFVMASYYGAVTTAPTDKAGIIALTKNVKNTKAQTATFTLSNQRSCYCYPASFGNLTSIKDANNFEYLSSYTKTNVTVDDVSYNVYTLTDPVTATGFKQVYA